MTKAVAIPYIIALVLGVAIIGLIGYSFVSSGGKFSSQSTKTFCENKFLQYCTTKLAKNSLSSASKSDFNNEVAECSGADLGSYDCNVILGIGSSPPGLPGTPPGSTCTSGVSKEQPAGSGSCSYCGAGWASCNSVCYKGGCP